MTRIPHDHDAMCYSLEKANKSAEECDAKYGPIMKHLREVVWDQMDGIVADLIGATNGEPDKTAVRMAVTGVMMRASVYMSLASNGLGPADVDAEWKMMLISFQAGMERQLIELRKKFGDGFEDGDIGASPSEPNPMDN